MAKAHDLIGWKFGALKVVARYENDPVGKTQWVCQCDCGGAHIARGDNLIMQRTTHCPACRLGSAPLVIECWTHLVLIDHPSTPGARVAGSAGFCTFRRGGKELIEPKWFQGRTLKRRPPFVLAESVRRAAEAGLLRCAPHAPAVHGWIRRHATDIRMHVHNEGEAVWAEWYSRTGQWLGPQDEIDMADVRPA
jgi:hypothetical protein